MNPLVNYDKYSFSYSTDTAPSSQEQIWLETSIPCILHMQDTSKLRKIARNGIPDSMKGTNKPLTNLNW